MVLKFECLVETEAKSAEEQPVRPNRTCFASNVSANSNFCSKGLTFETCFVAD